MDNFALTKEEQKGYIEDFYLTEDENGSTYSVVYGDGRVFEEIANTEENLARIEATQEKQMEKAIENKKHFKRKQTASEIMTFATGITLSSVGGVIANYIDATYEGAPSSLILGTAVGVITILGTIPPFAKMRKNDKLCSQIAKFEYRNEHKQQLDRIDSYNNALSGLSEDVKELIRTSKKPFSIFNASEFTLKDLEMIVENMEREESSGFQYRKVSQK